MKTLFASILMAVAIPAIVCAQWPYERPHPYVQSAWYHNYRTGLRLQYQRGDSLERFTQQLFWDDYEFQNALQRAVRGDDIRSPWTIDYSNPEPIPAMYSRITNSSEYKPQGIVKNYSIKDEIKLPKTKPGKPGELRKPNWIK